MHQNYNEKVGLARTALSKLLTAAFSLLVVFAVALPSTASAQAARVTFNNNQATVKQVLDAITQQTGLLAVYDVEDVNLNRTVNLHVSNSDVAGVLSKLFSGTNVTYVVNDTHIVLTTAAAQQQASAAKPGAANLAVKGRVSDQSGNPLAGVTVAVQGIASQGAITANDGTFSLQTHAGTTLLFSYLGYTAQKIVVNASTSTVNVTMAEELAAIEPVVVTALGIKRQDKSLSYNVQQIGSDKFNTVKDANVMNALSGKVAGVQVSTGAGGPGAAAKVVIRGNKSLSQSNNALYVIDGVPMFNISLGGGDGMMSVQTNTEGIADLNPEDIESMNVLTGPIASALYGSEAANGVIVVNTKKGIANKTVVTYTNNTTFMTPLMMPKMQNRYANNMGQFDSWGDPTTLRYDPKQFFNTGTNVNNNISLATGGEKSQSYLSAGANNATGILPNNTYDRYNFTFRNTTRFLKDRMTLDASASYIIQNDKNMVSQGQYFNPLPALYLFPRGDDFDEIRMYRRFEEINQIDVQAWPYGNQGLSLQNPYWIMNNMNRTNDKKRYLLNAMLQYKILDWLDVSARASVDNTNIYSQSKFGASTDLAFASKKGYYSAVKREYNSFYGDVLVNINKKICDFNLGANVGAAIKDVRSDMMSNMGNLREKYNLFSIGNLVAAYKPLQTGYRQQTQSVFANAEVSYKNMLFLTGTARNDWDSSLDNTNSLHSGFFYPSGGLSAVISEMARMPRWINLLKVRGGVSAVGTPLQYFISRPETQIYNDQTKRWDTRGKAPNPALQPERTISYEAGMNARFFRNALRFDLTLYHSNTYHQTFLASLSPSSGYSNVYVQAGDVQNEGIELSVGFDKTWGKFRWTSDYNFTANRNRINKLADGITNPVTGDPLVMPYLDKATLGSAGSAFIRLVNGGTMGDIYYGSELKKDGNGQIWVDSKTGKVDIQKVLPPVKAGSLLPDYIMGWNNGFAWKGVNLNVLVNARIGGLVVSNTEAILDYYGVSERTAVARDNGGVKINNGMVDAKMYYQTIGAGTGVGPYYIYNATNVRLQEVSLGYDLPRKWFNDKLSMRLSLIGRNLFMIYCKAPFDPELAPSTSTYYQGVDYFMSPSTRNMGFSLKLQF